jgi:hypothetical protein
MANNRETSRANWTSDNSLQAINSGSLQRIAAATELMARNHDELLRAKKSAEDSRDYWRTEANRHELRNRSLRGYITRLKKLNTKTC